MARKKPTPQSSQITRGQPVAFARRQRTDGGADDDEEPSVADAETVKVKPEEAAVDAGKPPAPAAAPASEPAPVAAAGPSATPRPTEPPPSRTRAETITMPAHVVVGTPPELPQTISAAPVSAGTVEDPTYMPSARQIPGGEPSDPAAPPGRVPPGDSRSLRRTNEFALVYRQSTFIISRFGVVGTRGQWRVVEYPTSSSASHAYAKECSRFVSEGFSDYRE